MRWQLISAIMPVILLFVLWTTLRPPPALTNHTGEVVTTNRPFDQPLVIFVHFHKAGGTSMVKKFQRKFRSWEYQVNGNPWFHDDNTNAEYLYEFWKYDSQALRTFLREEAQNVSFLAMEWNFFRENVTRSDLFESSERDVYLVTCLRDPYDRFVSNLWYNGDGRGSPKQPYANDPSLWMAQNLTWSRRKGHGFKVDGQFQHSNDPFVINYNRPNYYVAFLNSLAQEPHMIVPNHTHLEVAKERLSWFDAIVILEEPKTYAVLNRWFPDATLPLGNKNPKKRGIQWSRTEFFERNTLDLELYQYAIELAIERLSQHE